MLRMKGIVPSDLRRAIAHGPYKILVLLVAVDIVFVFTQLLHQFTSHFNPNRYSISWEYGYAELYMHIKEFWIVILLLGIFIKTRSLLMLVWLLLFSYILVDDVYRIHETMGPLLTSYFRFDLYFEQLGKNMGQQLWSVIIGIPFFIVLGVMYMKSHQYLKSISNSLFALLIVLIFFALFVDTIHAVFRHTELNSLYLLVEESGEMVTLSVIAWYLFYIDPENIPE